MNRWQNLPTIEALANTLSQEYAREPDVSIGRWRFAVLSLLFTVASTVLLTILLYAGVANPPQHARLTLNLLHTDGMTQTGRSDDLVTLELEGRHQPAFTLLVDGFNGTTNTAWGAWLGDPSDPHVVLIHTDGYFSFEPADAQPVWRRFHHIRQTAANRLRIFVQGGELTIYINEELALSAESGGGAAGLALYRRPAVQWQRIHMFVP